MHLQSLRICEGFFDLKKVQKNAGLPVSGAFSLHFLKISL